MEGKYPNLNQLQNDGPPRYPEEPPQFSLPPYSQGQHPPGPFIMTPGVAVVDCTVQPNMVPAIIVSPTVGPKPSHITCKSCRAEIVTRVEHTSSTKTHMMALLLCVFGCFPCAFIPYCTDSCRNADHYCPNCNAYIGAYSS